MIIIVVVVVVVIIFIIIIIKGNIQYIIDLRGWMPLYISWVALGIGVICPV